MNKKTISVLIAFIVLLAIIGSVSAVPSKVTVVTPDIVEISFSLQEIDFGNVHPGDSSITITGTTHNTGNVGVIVKADSTNMGPILMDIGGGHSNLHINNVDIFNAPMSSQIDSLGIDITHNTNFVLTVPLGTAAGTYSGTINLVGEKS